LNAFPAHVPHQRIFSSTELRVAISGYQTDDLVHIAVFVFPRSCTLYFSDTDLNTGESIAPEPDLLSALADQLQIAGAKLAVIGAKDITWGPNQQRFSLFWH
jgi:hypothetical protein